MSQLKVDTIRHTGGSADNITLDNSGNVGIGSSPSKKLHVKGSDDMFRLETTDATGKCTMTFWDPSAQKAYFGFASGGSDTFYFAQQENADIQIHTNNTERMRIDANGYVTKPANPTFNVKKLGDTNGSYSHSAGDLIWATENYDIGGGYNTSNGRYTAPVTGYYFFTFNIIYAAEAQHTIRYSINGSTEMEFHLHTTSTNHWNGTMYTATLQLDVNDYVTCYHSASSLYGGYYSNWSGFLIG